MGKKVMESQLLKIIAMEVAKRRIVMLAIVMEAVMRRIAMLAIVMEAAKKVMESQLLKTIVMEVVKRRIAMVAMVAMSTKAAKKRIAMDMGIKVVKKINPGTNLWYQQLKNMATKAAKEKIAMIAMVAIVMEAVKTMIAMDMGMDILNQLPKEDAVMDVIGAAVI